MSNNNCCVVGCSKTYRSSDGIHFYKFPNAKWHESRRKKWISAVRRMNIDGTKWVPNSHSKICSSHFVNGIKSDDPLSPSYLPSIFPPVYKLGTSKTSLVAKNNRYDRQMFRSSKTDYKCIDIECASIEPQTTTASQGVQTDCLNTHPYIEERNQSRTLILISVQSGRDAACQTDVPLCSSAQNTFVCSRNGNNAACQTSVLEYSVSKSSIGVNTTVCNMVKKHDVECGPNIQNNENKENGFLGYKTVKSNKEMKQIAGVSLNVFTLLLSLLESLSCFKRSKLSKENQLLLFLMRMKLGVSNSAISVLFLIHPSTASRIFVYILQGLRQVTQGWIFWPSKHAVKMSLPSTFSDFPNCRAIIDCTEMRTEIPSDVEQQVFMYSQYKSSHTCKFLIAIAPNGLITFISKAYGGRATDGYITQDCGILNLLEPGDLVLADKGFPQIKTHFSNKNCILVMPPFSDGHQFSNKNI